VANFEKEEFCWVETSQGTEFGIRKGLKTEEGVTHIFMKS
jgi:hypothetical protein